MTAQAVFEALGHRGLKLATAESCTGGMIAAALTDIAGSSAVFERGFVTYSNEAKMELLSVPTDLLRSCGAVSKEVARAMAEGAIRHSHADIAVAVTGVAGPSGGTKDKPVGLVCFCVAARDGGYIDAQENFGSIGRAAIRLAAREKALALVLQLLDQKSVVL